MKPIASVTLLKAALLTGVAAVALSSIALQAHAEVGVAAAVNVDAKGKPPGAQPRVITLGSNVVFNEEITTDSVGLVQILLLDGTTFTVGPNSQLTIDEFVYNPNTGDAKVVASLTKGVFRFVGARTSQTEGGATVKTPVGTIGIRGAVTNISYDPASGQSTAALVAGNKLTIVDGDGTQRIVYETGYTAVISKDAGGGTTTTVRKSTKEEAGLIQRQLSSKPGQNGGNAGAPPSDEQAEQVSQTNSGLPTIMDVPGSTRPVELAEQIDEVINDKTQDDINQDIANEEQQPQPNARLLTAPAGGYVVDPVNGGDPQNPIQNPGDRGLVGSTPDSDQGLLLTAANGRLATGNGSLDLPDYSGNTGDQGDFEGDETYPQLDRISIGNHVEDQQASYLGNALAGYAYAGRGDFVAYLLGVNGDPTQPVYVIYGTPTTPAQLEQFTDSDVKIREYALTPDPITPVEQFGIPTVPFFRDDAYGGVNAFYDPDGELGPMEPMLALSSTNLFLVEDEGGDVRKYQSWIHITGEGANQKSAAFLYAGGMFEGEDGNLQMGGGRRGTFRANAYEGPVNMRGGINTIAGATGEHFFGANADNFVIGTSLDPADGFTDAPLDFNEVFTGDPADGYLGDGSPFSTTHVASLIGEKAITEYGQPGQPTRTTREVTGFIAGLGEAFVGEGVYEKEAPYVLGGGAPNFQLSLDADTNQVRARAEVFDVLDQNAVVDSLLIRFGPHQGESGGNAFVDDEIFGAQKNNGAGNTRLRTDNGADLAHTGSFSPGSYMISGRANPIDGYQHLEGCETCDFIDWGWWGTRVETDANPDAGVSNERQDFVHMGTWVAGKISSEAEIEDIVDGSTDIPFGATVYYSGTVMGNVALQTEGGTAQYIATGDINASYNFNNRSGGVNIVKFDNNVNLSGALGETDSLNSALIGGALTGNNVYTANPYDNLSGSFSGAFVNNPAATSGPNVAAGMIGNFSFKGTDVSASGTTAAVATGID